MLYRDLRLIVGAVLLLGAASASAVAFNNPRLDRAIAQAPPSSELQTLLLEEKLKCEQASDLFSVQVLKDHRHGRETLELFYQRHNGASSEPYIVFLPGGPGGSSIGDDYGFNNRNVIYIDPRGTGCNYADGQDFVWDQVSTEQAAADVVDILKAEGITRFVLYGQSYGTVLGTVLARQLQEQGLPPRLVVLDGTLGRSIGDWANYVGAFVTISNLFLTEYPNIAHLFSSTKLPLGFSAEFWAWMLSNVGNRWDDMSHSLAVLGNRGAPDYASVVSQMTSTEQYFTQMPKNARALTSADFVMGSVLCSELSHSYWAEWPVELTGNQLTVAGSQFANLCPNVTYAPYDSQNDQLQSPLVYFQGDTDPQTPMASARYHFANQTQADKRFYVVEHGAHVAFMVNLQGCWDAIWSELLAGHYDLSTELDAHGHCRNPTSSVLPLRRRPPQHNIF